MIEKLESVNEAFRNEIKALSEEMPYGFFTDVQKKLREQGHKCAMATIIKALRGQSISRRPIVAVGITVIEEYIQSQVLLTQKMGKLSEMMVNKGENE